MILMTLLVAAVQAYGIVKPSKVLPAAGILHFKENSGIEIEGYFTKLDPKEPVTVSVWRCEESQGNPFSVGPMTQARFGTHFAYPVQELYSLGTLQADSTGYGEIFKSVKDLTLSDIKREDLKVVVHQHSKSLLVDLRWIED